MAEFSLSPLNANAFASDVAVGCVLTQQTRHLPPGKREKIAKKDSKERWQSKNSTPIISEKMLRADVANRRAREAETETPSGTEFHDSSYIQSVDDSSLDLNFLS